MCIYKRKLYTIKTVKGFLYSTSYKFAGNRMRFETNGRTTKLYK